MGLLYIASVLEKDGNNVKIIDYSAESYNEKNLEKELADIDLVGITVLSVSIRKTKEIVKKIKKYNSKIKIIIGGPHCILFPDKSLEETHADISVQGPGEKTILEIKKALKEKKKLSDVNGIYYKEGKKIKKGKPISSFEDIDSIPNPSRNLVRKYNYGIGYNPNFKKGEFTSIITSRGCPYTCKFCSRGAISMKKFLERSTDSIINELKIIEKQGFRYVAFVDDCFIANKKHSMEIFRRILDEKIQLKYYITAARVDSADEKLYELMKKAGVVFIQFGLESGNQDVLDFYNKNTTIEKIKYAVNLSNKKGFYTVGSFIIGAPFETKEHFKNTIDFAKKLPLVSVSFVPLKYMAGSELWNNAVEQGKIATDEYVVSADKKRNLSMFSKEELISWGYHGHRKFVLRPRFIINFLKISLKQGDFSFILSYLSFYFKRSKKYRSS
jgi:radical SAM superfamily enzyme YgiQ (UPF0313 family)